MNNYFSYRNLRVPVAYAINLWTQNMLLITLRLGRPCSPLQLPDASKPEGLEQAELHGGDRGNTQGHHLRGRSGCIELRCSVRRSFTRKTRNRPTLWNLLGYCIQICEKLCVFVCVHGSYKVYPIIVASYSRFRTICVSLHSITAVSVCILVLT